MKKKLLSLLMSAAVLLGTFPAAVSAEETAGQSGAKLGVKRGDIVTYAGKDTPIEWRVIDPDKTNTDDNKGMLLLSDNVSIDAAYTSIPDVSGLNSKANEFYDANFSDFYKNAVLSVSKGDELYTFNGNTLHGKLDNAAVFALSAQESDNLTTEEKSFSDGDWWLRSIAEPKFPRKYPRSSYIDVEYGNITLSGDLSTKIKKLRPAVNLDKTKLANLDGKPLLLPAGEFTEAKDNLAPTGTASKWKLSVKNDVKINSAYSNNTNTQLKINVTTDLTDFSDNDHISVIIVKPDGSIPYYGRFTMNRTGFANIRTGMPSDIDTVNDSLYVFYENYNGALSGSVSELKKVCFEHDLEYEIDPKPENNRHYWTCKNCGSGGSGPHTMSYQGDEITHTGTCELCGYEVTGNHEYKQQYLDIYEKEFKCSVCVKHTFTAIMGDFEKSKAILRNSEIDLNSIDCVYGKEDSNLKWFLDDDGIIKFNCTDNKAAVKFKTKQAIKAIGIRTAVPPSGAKDKTPSTLTLYGKSSDSEEYSKIGAVVFKPILGNYNSHYYSFLFADTSSVVPYSDYKLELYNEDGNTIYTGSFGLLSEPSSALDLTLTGALAQDAPSVVYPGVDSSFTLITLDGHPKKSEISVTAGDKALDDSGWTYDENSGKFTLLGEHITNNVVSYKVTVVCENRSISVEFRQSENLDHEPFEEPTFGKDFTCYFYDKNNPDIKLYLPQEGDYTVENGNNNITEYCRFEDDKLTVPKEHITAPYLTITVNEAGMNNPENSEIMIERKGSWGTTPRYYRTAEDALRDISYPGSKDITVISKNDTVSLSSNAAVTLNGTEINLNLNGKTLNYTPESPIFLTSGTKVNVKNGTIKCPGAIFRVEEGSVLQLTDVAVIPSNSGGGIEVNGGTIEKISNSDSVYINMVYIGNNGKLTLEKGTINHLILEKDYDLQIYSGTVNNVINYGSSLDYKNFLAPGSEFYDIKDLEAFNNGKPTGFSVKCGHLKVDDDTGICGACGEQLQTKATCGETVNYYDNITEAIAFSNENAGAAITLYTDTEAAATSAPLIFSGKNTTLDLNGKAFTVTGHETIEVSGTLTITGNGNVNSDIVTNGDSALITIENGEFNGKISGRLLLNGGKFKDITAYTNNSNDILGNGMAYKKNSDNTFITDCAKNIRDVTVTKAPFKITKQPENKFISDISAGGTISVETDVTPGYENDITYMWYEKAYHPENGWMENELGVYNDVYQLPTNAYRGEQKMYKCVISCKGYSVSTDYAICTFGSNTPGMEYDNGKDFICVKNYDKDAVFAVAAYRDGKLLAIETTELKANSGPFISKEPFSGIEVGADCLKAFLWDCLDTMRPLTVPIEIRRNNILIQYNDTDFGAYSEEIPCTVIVASYNGNKLIDSKSVRLDETKSVQHDYGNYKETYYETETDYKSIGLNTENSTDIKFFVWKDFQSMKPLGFDIIKDEDQD